jgi:hypothetical protein
MGKGEETRADVPTDEPVAAVQGGRVVDSGRSTSGTRTLETCPVDAGGSRGSMAVNRPQAPTCASSSRIASMRGASVSSEKSNRVPAAANSSGRGREPPSASARR